MSLKLTQRTKTEEVDYWIYKRSRAKQGACIRCDADPVWDAPGCLSHDWSWEHGCCDAPQWYNVEVFFYQLLRVMGHD